MNQAIQNDVNAQKEQQIKSLENVSRIAANALVLLSESPFKGQEAKAVAEVMDWLNAVHAGVQGELKALKPSVTVEGPKQEANVVDAEVVSEGSGK